MAPMSATAPLRVRSTDWPALERAIAGPGISPAHRTRAQIVLLAAQGASNSQIARQLGVSRPTVIQWRHRYAADGLAGLRDRPRSGRPRRVDETELVAATFSRPPRRTGRDTWSARSLGAELGVHFAAVARVWQRWGLQPGREDRLTLPGTPRIDPWCQEVVGLLLNPPEVALAVTMAAHPRMPSYEEVRRPADSSAPAGADAHAQLMSGIHRAAHRAVDRCLAPQPHEVFLDFLAALGRRQAGRALHVVVDSVSSLDHPQTRMWLARNRAVRVHRSPAVPSWAQVAELLLTMAAVAAELPDSLGQSAQLTRTLRDAVADWAPDAGHLSWVDPIISPFASSAAGRLVRRSAAS